MVFDAGFPVGVTHVEKLSEYVKVAEAPASTVQPTSMLAFTAKNVYRCLNHLRTEVASRCWFKGYQLPPALLLFTAFFFHDRR